MERRESGRRRPFGSLAQRLEILRPGAPRTSHSHKVVAETGGAWIVVDQPNGIDLDAVQRIARAVDLTDNAGVARSFREEVGHGIDVLVG